MLPAGIPRENRRLAALAAVGFVIGVAGGLAVLDGGLVKQARSAVAARAAPPAAPVPPAKVDYRRLGDRIARLMQQPDMVGLAVGTIEAGHVRFVRGYGETRAGTGSAVTPDTVFRWASLSKGVASALVVGLAQDGRLSLDAPLPTLGTSLTVPGDPRRVTAADILSHRVGLVHNAWDDRLEAGEDPKLLRAELGRLPPYCPPATCYSYQNIAYDAASEIVERVAGVDYASLARQRLFAPLGMTRASIGRAGLEGAGDWAEPHHRRTPVAVTDPYYRVPAAGGVNSSIRDLLRWMSAQMGAAPVVLSPAALATMHRPRIATPARHRRGPMDRALGDAAYGLGWRHYRYAGRDLVGHRGAVDGYGSLILFDPADRSGIVMLWNSGVSRPARLQLEFFDALYGLPPTDWLGLDAAPPGAATPSAEPQAPPTIAGAG